MASSTPAAHVPIARSAFPALILANIILPLGPILVRLADVGPVAAAFWRLAIALPFLLLLALPELKAARPGARDWGAMMLAGLFFAADLAAWHLGIPLTKVANTTIFGNISGLLLPLWGLLMLRQSLRPMQGFALLLAAAGAAVMMGSSYELSPAYLRGDLLCLLAGGFYTAYLLMVQDTRRRVGSWGVLSISSLAGAGPLLITAIAMGERIMPGNWTPVIALALSSQLIGQGLLTYAIGWFSPLVLGLSLLLQPAVSALLGWILFGEVLTFADWVGASAVAAALVLVRLPGRP